MKKENILLTLAVVLSLSILIYSFLRDNYRERMLKNTKTTEAIILRVIKKTSKDDRGGKFRYTVNGKYYYFKQSGNF